MTSPKGGLKVKVRAEKNGKKVASTRHSTSGEFSWYEDRCVGCMRCANICPVDAITVDRRRTLVKKIQTAPCSAACPAGVDASRYVRLISEGKFAQALAVVRERIPFPSVCGYVCVHPCESKCQRGNHDEPILIRVLKRFAAENDDGEWRKHAKKAPFSGKKVAIIGSGPAGLTAAYYLARLGHGVTVFEAMPEVGGMLRVAIPPYRLPRQILDAEIKEIINSGVEVKTNTPVTSLNGLFDQGFNAVFVAVGAAKTSALGIEGEDDSFFKNGLAMLQDVNMGKDVSPGNKVAVIGGGNTAIDVARTARRLGAKDVSIIYRRTIAQMPASSEEIESALAEGIKIVELASPVKVSSQNGSVNLTCQRMKLGEPDESGRPRPEPIGGKTFTTIYSSVFTATGQKPDVPSQFDVALGKGEVIQIDEKTMATSKEGVFAGGDAVTGPASVIQAIAAGRRAVEAIDKYFGGAGNIDEVLATPIEQEKAVPFRQIKGGRRVSVPHLSVEKRLGGFEEEELSLPRKSAIKEADRCLRCDLSYQVDDFKVNSAVCIYCGRCFEACLWDALSTGYSYEEAAQQHKEQEEEVEQRSRVFDRTVTILVGAVVVIVLSIVATSLFGT